MGKGYRKPIGSNTSARADQNFDRVFVNLSCAGCRVEEGVA